MPAITVIMPVYNTQRYLNQSIHSVLNQSFADFELILINDGSTDYSLLYCEALAKQDNRIRVIDLPHDGVATARAAGIRVAKGNYISFVDSDDQVEKEFLQHLYRAITESSADIAMCQMVERTANRSSYMNLPIESGVYSGSALELLKEEHLFCGKDRMTHFSFAYLCDKLFRAELIRDNMRYMDKRAVISTDTLLSTACFLDCTCFNIIDAVGYHYYMRPDSITHRQQQCSPEIILHEIELLRKALLKIMEEKGYPELCYKADTLYAYTLYGIIDQHAEEEPCPISENTKELIRSLPEQGCCDRWVETAIALKSYIE